MRALRLAVVASMLQVALTACPKTHALVGARATFPAGTQKGVAGTAEVIDDCTIKLTDFTYDGTGPSVWMYGFEKVSDIPGGPGIFLEGPGDATKITRAFNREEYTIDIVGHTLDDFSVLSIWCEEFKIDFGHVVFSAPTSACPKTHALVGAKATFPAGTQKGVAGTAEVIDDCTIKLTDFTYDGTGPSVWMYGFKKASDIPGGPGIFLEGPGDATKITRAFNREEYTIKIVGHTLDDFSVLSIWCEEFKIDFGHVVFMAPTSACPKTHALVGAKSTFPPGTQKGVAGTAEVIDDCTIKLTDFTYDGTGPSVWMYGFKKVSDIPGGPGIFLEGPGDATKITRAFNREEYTIKIVGHTLDDFSVLSIWCEEFRIDFGHVVFTAPTNAPDTNVAEGGAYLSPKTWLIASAALLLAML